MNRGRRAICAALVVLPACGDQLMTMEPRDLTAPPPDDLSMPGPSPLDLAFQGNHDLVGQCPPAGNVGGGPASAIAVGEARFVAAAPGFSGLFVCRDAGGLYALSPVCTHAGCTVNFVDAASGFACPCHGGKYDFDGAVTRGPPTMALVHYAVCVDGSGDVIVDVRTIVPAATRA